MFTPLIENADIQQEAEILRLRGKTPNMGIVRMKLERLAITDLELDLDTWEEHLDFALGIETPEMQLVSWAQDQSSEVQRCIDDFLDDPEALFSSTMAFLKGLDLLVEKAAPPKKPANHGVSYASMMHKALPCTKTELVALMSRMPISRPAATVRQWLRRNRDRIQEDELGRYHSVA